MESGYLTVEQAAEYLNTNVRFIRRIVAERRVVFYKVGGHVRFSMTDLENFVQEGRVNGGRKLTPFRRAGSKVNSSGRRNTSTESG